MTKVTLVSEEIKEENSNVVDFSKVETDGYKKPSVSNDDIEHLLSDYSKSATVDQGAENENGSNIPDITKPKRKRKTKEEKEREKMVVSGEIISGALFITLIDLLIPMAMASVNNIIDKKGKKINFNSLRLKQTQKNELEPFADQVMKELQVKANPIVVFIAALISIYGLNFAEAKFAVQSN